MKRIRIAVEVCRYVLSKKTHRSITLIVSLLYAVTSVLWALYLTPLINNGLILGRLESSEIVLLFLLILCLVVTNWAASVLFSTTSTDFNCSVTSEIYKCQLAQRSISEYCLESILSGIQNSLRRFCVFIDTNFMTLIVQPLVFCFSVIGMIVVNWRVAALVVSVSIIVSLLNNWCLTHMQRGSELLRKCDNSLYSIERSTICNLDYIRAAHVNDYVTSKHDICVNDKENAQIGLLWIKAKTYVPALLCEYLPTTALLLSVFFIDKNRDYGRLVSMVQLTANISLPFSKLIRAVSASQEALPLIDELEQVLVNYRTDEKSVESGSDACYMSGVVSVNDVSYCYEDSKPVFRSLNLLIEEGSKVLIHGPSGCGKSTLLQLIAGFLVPTSGSIYVFGQSTSSQKEEIFGQISYVAPNGCMLSTSIEQNITLECRTSQPERYSELVDLLSLGNVVSRFGNDNVLDTKVKLSGGEQMKINLARALYSGSRLLLLDEFTTGLDSETEARILGILDKYDGTVIAVSHKDLSCHFDSIYFMNGDGGLVKQDAYCFERS